MDKNIYLERLNLSNGNKSKTYFAAAIATFMLSWYFLEIKFDNIIDKIVNDFSDVFSCNPFLKKTFRELAQLKAEEVHRLCETRIFESHNEVTYLYSTRQLIADNPLILASSKIHRNRNDLYNQYIRSLI